MYRCDVAWMQQSIVPIDIEDFEILDRSMSIVKCTFCNHTRLDGNTPFQRGISTDAIHPKLKIIRNHMYVARIDPHHDAAISKGSQGHSC